MTSEVHPLAVRAVIDQMRHLVYRVALTNAICARDLEALINRLDHLLHALAEPQMQENKEELTLPAHIELTSDEPTDEDYLTRVGPPVDCVAPIGSTAEPSPGAVTAAERTER